MKLLSKVIAVLAVTSIAACTNPSRFDNDSVTDPNANAGGQNTAPVNTGPVPGSADDPRSPLYFQQTVGDRVLFPVDQYTLTTNARGVLNGQANWLKANTDYDVVIEGHADEQGTREYNLALGSRRANAVKEYLVSQGVPSGRVKVLSYGKERPIEVCSQESCYAKNRRAVTIISTGLTS